MKRVLYRGYLLQGAGIPLRSGAWSPEGRVYQQHGDTLRITQILSRYNLTFPSMQEAENHAVHLDGIWVDRNP
jgi:hypothetical protein